MERCSAATLDRHGLLLSYCRLHCSAISSAFSASGLHGAEGSVPTRESMMQTSTVRSLAPMLRLHTWAFPAIVAARRPPIALGGFRYRPVHPAAPRVGRRQRSPIRGGWLVGRMDATLPACARPTSVKPSSRSACSPSSWPLRLLRLLRTASCSRGWTAEHRASPPRPHLRSVADHELRLQSSGTAQAVC